MSNPQEEDFRYTIHDQTFEPTVQDLAREESRVTYTGGIGTPRVERPVSEQETFLQDEIVKFEHRLVTLRYLQAIRAARETDQGWLRKTLGRVKR